MTRPLIIITNDDGIESPGLWAVAQALEDVAETLVAAPLVQQSGAGRSMPATSLGHIHRRTVTLWGREFEGFGIHGTPAQAVQHAVLELAPREPQLLISGINYGENVGTGITISGTVGAALEAATFGVLGLAVSYQVEKQYHMSQSTDVDFSVAAYFTRLFALKLLGMPRQYDVDALKVEVPSTATRLTPWRVAKVSRQRYFQPLKPMREDLEAAGRIDYKVVLDESVIEPDSDVSVLVHERAVAVTPISLDLTSRVDLKALEQVLVHAR